jgi:hypothetical protein
MWDLLFALAQVVCVLAVVAGFGLISWSGGSRWAVARLDDS